MAATTQISAHVSMDTKERLERFVRATGVTRARLIEQALLHHLRALDELPADVIVLTRESAERVRDLTSRPLDPVPRIWLKSNADSRLSLLAQRPGRGTGRSRPVDLAPRGRPTVACQDPGKRASVPRRAPSCPLRRP